MPRSFISVSIHNLARVLRTFLLSRRLTSLKVIISISSSGLLLSTIIMLPLKRLLNLPRFPCTAFHPIMATSSGTVRARSMLRFRATSIEVLTNIMCVSYPSASRSALWERILSYSLPVPSMTKPMRPSI